MAMQVSAMASTTDLPREGCLNLLFQMFSFFKSKHNVVAMFDPSYPERDQSQFLPED